LPRTPCFSLRWRRAIVAYAVIDAAYLDDALCNRGHLHGRSNRRTPRLGRADRSRSMGWTAAAAMRILSAATDHWGRRLAPPTIWEASWWKRPRVAKRYPFARPHPPGTHHTAGFSRRSPPRPSKSPTDAPFGCCGSCPGSATEETPSRAPPVGVILTLQRRPQCVDGIGSIS
jgi:hypothetical protein